MTLRNNWRHLLFASLMVGSFGMALAQMPQGLSAQSLQLPQAAQGAAGGLLGGAGAGLGALGSLGIGASAGIRSADPLPSSPGLNCAGMIQPMEP
jgi:hypothetical protein